MQYGQILKRSWSIAWRNKNLWWLGLFAGAGAGVNVNSGGSNFNSSDFTGSGSSGAPFDFAQVWSEVARFLPFIIAGILLLFVVWLAMIIIQVAARGGLVDQAAVADDGARPLARRGWGAGFHRWWPLALMMAILALPGLVALLLIVMFAFAMIAVPMYAGQQPSFAAILTVILVAGGVAVVLMPVSIVLSVLEILSEREIMLAEMGPWESLKASWHLVRTRFKDVALFWLIMLGIGMAFGVALVIVTLMVVGVGVGLAIGVGVASSRAIVPMVLVGVVAVMVLSVLLAVVGAAYATFHSTAWTLFWRRATGRIADAVPAPTPDPVVAGAYAPPAPPMAPQAPAPPAPPAAAPQSPAPPMATPQPVTPPPPVAPAPPMAQPAAPEPEAPQAPAPPADAPSEPQQ